MLIKHTLVKGQSFEKSEQCKTTMTQGTISVEIASSIHAHKVEQTIQDTELVLLHIFALYKNIIRWGAMA